MPEIFEDPSYKFINQNVISTSTLPSENFGVGGFCPVVPHGYGFGYQIRGSDLGTIVSVYKDISNCGDMLDAVTATFNEIARVVQNSFKS